MSIDQNRRLGVGIIGAGIMGRSHAASFGSDRRTRLVGVASLPAAGAKELAQAYEAPFHCEDYRELLARPDIDLVTIATPDHMHRDICTAAAAAGKHFMVEKPLTTNLAEADALIAAVEASGVKAMTCFNHRWIPAYARAHQEIAAGHVGKPVLAYARKNDRIHVPTKMLSWAAATTPAWFLSCHDVDLVTWFFGPEAKASEVYATAVWGVLRGRGIETPDAIQAQVRFSGGQLATFEACWIYPDTYPSMTDSFIEIVGEKGMMHLKRDSEQIELATEAAFEYPRTSIGAMIHGVQRGAVSEALQHVVTCVLEDKEPLVTLESSRHVTAILDALHRSLESGVGEKVR
ncbi:MAG TPA: Gfo/Idh/MocA family oxidoreductase [Rhizobiaceae bacterium]|nr:Gfo/Idh/MocA family oxidoreductase [Rhizobiaceae bacterium]